MKLLLRVVTIGYGHLWFIGFLFWYFLISWFLLVKFKINENLAIVVLLVLVFVLSVSTEKRSFFYDFPTYYTYFIAGYCYHRIKSCLQIIGGAIFLFAMSIICIYMYNLTFLIPIYCISSLVLIEVLLGRLPFKVSNLTTFINNTSFGVYIFHLIWLYLFYFTVIKLGLNDFLISHRLWISSLLAILTIPCSIATTLLLRKLNLKFLI